MDITDKTDSELLAPQSTFIDKPEPRWPAAIAATAVGLCYLALPPSLSIGPRWLVPVLVAALVIPTMVSHRRKKHKANLLLGLLTSSVCTLFLIWSLTLVVIALPTAHAEPPLTMLKSAAALWICNILIFAMWYWRLDGGGPNGRAEVPGHDRGAFLFPQMTEEGFNSAEQNADHPCWSPHFIDYLFIAFNTSTAFSPTDVPVLSRWAKVLTMVQSSISLLIVVLLVARAVNILQP